LQEYVQWDTRNLPVQEPSQDVGKRRYSQDHERVLEFEVKERDARVQISMDVCDIQTAH
jgi:hypothetical protein